MMQFLINLPQMTQLLTSLLPTMHFLTNLPPIVQFPISLPLMAQLSTSLQLIAYFLTSFQLILQLSTSLKSMKQISNSFKIIMQVWINSVIGKFWSSQFSNREKFGIKSWLSLSNFVLIEMLKIFNSWLYWTINIQLFKEIINFKIRYYPIFDDLNYTDWNIWV